MMDSTFLIIFIVIWIIFEFCSVVISVIGNSTVIYVMSSASKLRKKSNYFIISIAVADLSSSVFITFLTLEKCNIFFQRYLNPVKARDDKSYEGICLWLASVCLVLTTVSILQFVFVAIDRFRAIYFPISYQTKSVNSTKITIISCWIFGFIFGSSPLIFEWTGKLCSLNFYHHALLSFMGVTSIITITIFYALIYRAFLRQVKNNKIFNAINIYNKKNYSGKVPKQEIIRRIIGKY